MSETSKNRNKFIGGSDVASILGLNRYKTSYEIWDEKKNNNNPFTGNNATEWGKLLEPVIIQYFENQHGLKVFDNNARYISKEHEFLGCHPDGICNINGENWLIEVKTVSSNAFKHWQNELPLEYYCQVQHNLFVTGLKNAKFIYLVLDDRSYNEIDVTYHADYVAMQNKTLVDWWNNYIIGDNQPIKTSTDYEKENPTESIIEADDEAVNIYNQLIEVKSKYKEIEAKKDELEDLLKIKIGSATELMHGLNTLATWRPSTSARVDTKKLKEELPETFIKYAKETTSRKLLIKL